MAQIIRIGDNYYSDFRNNNKRIRRFLCPYPYKAKAEKLLADLVLMLRSEKHGTQPTDISLFFFEEKYLKFRKAEFNDGTFDQDERAFRMVKTHGRPIERLKQLTPEYLIDFGIRAKEAGMNKRTLSGHLRRLKTAMTTAEEWGMVPAQTWKSVKTLPDGKRVEWFTFDQLEKVIALCKGAWKTAAMIMAHAGLRSGEVRHLEWSDIDFEARLIHVRIKDEWRPKGSRGANLKERAVDLIPELEDYLKALPRHSKHVLGELKLEKTYCRFFRRMSKRVGFKVFPHKFRHTYASFLISSGATLDEVGALLGHTDRRSTQIYAHMMPHARRTAVDRMQAWRTAQQAPQASLKVA